MVTDTDSSRSPALRASHILHIAIDAVTPGGWTPRPEGGVTRQVTLKVTVKEVLKGSAAPPAGGRVTTEVSQLATGTGRIAGMGGAWSHIALEPGSEWVVYCESDDDRVAEMLKDPACRLVLPADTALAGARLATQTATARFAAAGPGAPDAGLATAVAQAAAIAPSLDGVTAQHLWVAWGDAAMADPANLDLVLGLIERPDLSNEARATLLNEVYSRMIASPAIAPQLIEHLTRTLFRLLDLPQAASLHDPIVDIYLPNLLGLGGDGARRAAVDVFADRPAERGQAEAALRRRPDSTGSVALQAWLGPGGR